MRKHKSTCRALVVVSQAASVEHAKALRLVKLFPAESKKKKKKKRSG